MHSSCPPCSYVLLHILWSITPGSEDRWKTVCFESKQREKTVIKIWESQIVNIFADTPLMMCTDLVLRGQLYGWPSNPFRLNHFQMIYF